MNHSALLIFDLDGTLFRAETVTTPAVQRTFQAHGLPVPSAPDIHAYFGKALQEYHDWLCSLCPPHLAAALVAGVDRLELELVSEAGELYPDVRETLAELAASGHPMALCSNGPQDYCERVLSAHGLSPFFAAVRYRRAPQDTKPRMARELLGQFAPRTACVIGDRRDDIEAAHQNGLVAIASRYGYGSEAELAAADAALRAFADLPSLLYQLERRPIGRT